MRNFLLTSVFVLAPLAAFAAQPQATAGDVNLAATNSLSVAGISSGQSTMAAAKAGGNGAVIVGTISGNHTAITTNGAAQASPAGSYTSANTTQANVGGTVSGGLADNAKHQTGASGTTDGQQWSQDTGSSVAAARNVNLGGFVATTPATKPGRGHGGAS